MKERSIDRQIFVCLDCETTGLEPANDRVIEVAAVKFTLQQTVDSVESLIDPECPISETSMAIHHICDEMVQGKPKIREFLPTLIQFVGPHILVGHGVGLDIAFLAASAKRCGIPFPLETRESIDTLRLARLYGDSPNNSLETLRHHFNIAQEGAHRAMNDVVVNIEVFKFLVDQFKTTQEVLERLKRPIAMKTMPLGKHKGRRFSDIPLEYLLWAADKDFDQDLLFSIRSEIKKRRSGSSFHQSTNPFVNL